jgi:phosphatidylinositol-3-phosphatase
MRSTVVAVGVVVAVAFGGLQPAQAGGSSPCQGTTAHQVSHIVVVLMENKDESSIIGSAQAPYLNHLAMQCALATNYHAVAHPSLPNYLALTGGTTAGVTDDKPPAVHGLGGSSIFGQLKGSWRSYQESMTVPCQKYGQGSYAPKHNPAAYYTALTDCSSQDVPLPSNPTFDAAFTFVTPNLTNDMHDGTITQGDRWVSTFVRTVLSSPQYQAGSLMVFIVWDENDGPHHVVGNQVPCIVVAPSVTPGTRLTASYTHYSLLAAWEDLLGLPRLKNAAAASSMVPALRHG